jgi:DNA-binding response OmpR family regulator
MAQTASSNLNVLVVDDEQDIRDGSERILSRMGFGVFKAIRGDEAQETFKTEEVAIVLFPVGSKNARYGRDGSADAHP